MQHRFKVFTIVCFLVLMIISGQLLQAQVFSIPLRISTYYRWGGDPDLVIDSQGNINVVISFGYKQSVYFTRSSDGGQSFSPLQRISSLGDSLNWNCYPKIAVDEEDNIYIFWINTVYNLYNGIAFSFSPDGINFSTPWLISDPNIIYSERVNDVAVDKQGNINLIISKSIMPNVRTIDYRRITNGGQTLLDPVTLPDRPERKPFAGNIYVDDQGNINAVWQEYSIPGDAYSMQVMFRRSTDGGQTFSAPMNISTNEGQSNSPRVGLDALGNINVIWTTGNLYFSRSEDGVDFDDPINFHDLFGGWGTGGHPDLAVDEEGNINIVWTSTWLGILFSRSTDGGNTFSFPIVLFQRLWGVSSRLPLIDVDSKGNISVIFESNISGDLEIFFTRSTDGASFSDPVKVSNRIYWCDDKKMAIDSEGSINLIWADNSPSYTYYSSMRRLKADAGPDREVIVGETVLFDGTGSYALDHDIVDYQWDFGEAFTANGVQVNYVYTFPNAYTISLTVTDDVGKVASDTAIITVITVTQASQNLIDDVNRLVNEGKIAPGKKYTGMIRKLNESLAALERGNERVACNKLHDFIDQVNAAINTDPLTPEEGQELIDAANTLTNILCGQ